MVGGKEEVEEEVSAAEAVYGEECVVVDRYPPHLNVHLKPRTADVSSQQFVEAVIGIRAGPQYPEEPPHISIIDSKGLDEQRQKYLITTISEKASELTSCQMLIALCEEAVEQLSNMNHPDGDCPLCLSPLVDEDGSHKSFPFMKLMSCFHCFHGECIIRWWNWLQLQNEPDATSSSCQAQGQRGIHEKNLGRCPVCRKVFLAKDIEHVLDLVGTNTSLDDSGRKLDDVDENILHSDSEVTRRQKFEAILKIQQERSGLIEPKKNEVLLPGMYLPRPVASPVEVVDTKTAEDPPKHIAANSKSDIHAKESTPSSSNSNSNSRRQRARNTHSRRNKGPPFEQNGKDKEANTRGASSKASASRDRNATARKDNGVNPKPQVRQWIRKENDPTS